MGLSLKDTSFARYYLEEGKKEGKKEGLKEGKTEIAFRLLEKGHSIEDVAEITGFSIQEIKGLKERKP